jgi:MFS family permease
MASLEQAVGLARPGLPPAIAVNALGLYVLVMYGVTYYAVTTAAVQMAAGFGVTVSTMFGLLTASLLATAVLAPRFGRLTDRFGAARVLLLGAVARAAMLAVMAVSGDLWLFALAFLLVQILGQITEYDAAFAAAVDVAGARARAGIGQITLWGGFASTAFWPLTTYLLGEIGWRHTFLCFAALMLVVCGVIGLALVGQSRRGSAAEPDDTASAANPTLRCPPVAPPPLALVALAFAFGSVVYNLPSLMLPVLEGFGLGAAALLVGMIFGPAQTAGRLIELVFGDKIEATTVAVIAAAMVTVSLALLMSGGLPAALAFAVLFGAGAGVGAVVRGSVVLALYGRGDYATRLGTLSRVRLVVTAITPFALSIVLERLGAPAVVVACLLASLVSLALFIVLARRRRAVP